MISKLPAIVEAIWAKHRLIAPSVVDLIKAARADETIMEELMQGALEERALAAVQMLAQRDKPARREFTRDPRTPAASPKPMNRQALSDWAGEVRQGLLDTYQLPDGTRLRDATREALSAAADLYRDQAGTMLGYAKWLDLIAQGLLAGERVSARTTEERVAELQRLALAEAQRVQSAGRAA